MYNEYIQAIKDDIAGLTRLKDAVRYLSAEYENLRRLEESLSQNVQQQDAAYLALKSVEQMAMDILVEEGMDALVKTKEFDVPVFRRGFLQALRDPENIRFRVSQSGALIVRITMRSAGDLEDYAAAIDSTREDMRISIYGKRPLPPALASKMWKEKYYQPAREGTTVPIPKKKKSKTGRTRKGKERKDKTAEYIRQYWQTIESRAARFMGLAPYWRLINEGTQPLNSDRGGKPYPRIRATRFIERTIKRLKELYNQEFREANEKIRDLQETRRKVISASRYCEQRLAKLESILENRPKRVGRREAASRIVSDDELREFVEQELERQLGSRMSFADAERMNNLVYNILNNLEGPIKFELTQTGSPERVRVRYRELLNIVREFRSRRR